MPLTKLTCLNTTSTGLCEAGWGSANHISASLEVSGKALPKGSLGEATGMEKGEGTRSFLFAAWWLLVPSAISPARLLHSGQDGSFQ